jgi:hypothetical protein
VTPADRVRRLVASGDVGPEEGARLLSALQEVKQRSPLATLLDPFERFGGGVAAVAGLALALAGFGVSRLGVRFDGFLDMHVSRTVVPSLQVALVDQLASWLVPALCFWAYARVLSRSVRLVDFVGMVGLARVPVVVSAVLNVLLLRMVTVDASRFTPGLLLVAVVGLVFLALHLTLLYRGFKNASGLSGAKLVGGFIGVGLAAEVLSKLVLFLV